MSLKDEIEILDTLGGKYNKYYTESEVIDTDSGKSAKLWLYPYYLPNLGTSSVKCLIYAYKEGQENEDVEMVDLNSDLKACANVQQAKNESCDANQASPSGTYQTHEAAKNALTNGVGVVSTNNNCDDRCNKNCTSLKGIPTDTISKINTIKAKCSACSVTITGGTEIGHKTHGMGKSVVDLSWDEKLAQYLKGDTARTDGVKPSVMCTTEARSAYRINCNYNEKEDHLHVQF